MVANFINVIHFPKPQTARRSMTQIDQQTQTKTVSRIVTLISTRTITHTSSASDILGVPIGRTITSSCVVVAQQIEETSASESHWPITSSHWALTSRSKDHFNWTPIAFHTTILSVNSSYWTLKIKKRPPFCKRLYV